MTEAQRLTTAYWDAAEVFDNDIHALAIALGGMLKKAGKKNDVEYVVRELKEGRLQKMEKFFPRIDEMSTEDINKCKAHASCRFADELGRLEEVAMQSENNGKMPNRLIKQELVHLNAMQDVIYRIKENLRKASNSVAIGATSGKVIRPPEE